MWYAAFPSGTPSSPASCLVVSASRPRRRISVRLISTDNAANTTSAATRAIARAYGRLGDRHDRWTKRRASRARKRRKRTLRNAPEAILRAALAPVAELVDAQG